MEFKFKPGLKVRREDCSLQEIQTRAKEMERTSRIVLGKYDEQYKRRSVIGAAIGAIIIFAIAFYWLLCDLTRGPEQDLLQKYEASHMQRGRSVNPSQVHKNSHRRVLSEFSGLKFQDEAQSTGQDFEVKITGQIASGYKSMKDMRQKYQNWKIINGKLPNILNWVPYFTSMSPSQANNKGKLLEFDRVFGKKADGLFPYKFENQQVKVVKIVGQEGAHWYGINYNNTKFVIITNGKDHPESIISPNGVIAIFSKDSSIIYPQLKDVFITVTKPDGSYFNIPNELWNKMQAISDQNISPFPPVHFQGTNVVNSKLTAEGASIRDQVLRIGSGSQIDMIFSKIDSSGTNLSGEVHSSSNGYQVVDVPDYVTQGSVNQYRVCIYCLYNEAHRVGNIPKYFKLTTINSQPEYQFIGKDHLAETFWEKRLSVPSQVFVLGNYSETDSVMAEIGQDKFLQLNRTDLEHIVELKNSGKLKLKWITEIDLKESQNEGNLLPVIVSGNKTYRLDLPSVKAFANNNDENFEKGLKSVGVSNQVDTLAPYLSGIDVSSPILERLFQRLSSEKGLFISSDYKLPTKTWPFILKKQGHIVRKYYLNLALARPAMGIPAVPYTNVSTSLSPIAKTYLRESDGIDKVIVSLPKQDEYLSTLPVTIGLESKKLTQECISNLSALNNPSILVPFDVYENRKLSPEERMVYVNGKFEVLNSKYISEKFSSNQFKDEKEKSAIQSCVSSGHVVNKTSVNPTKTPHGNLSTSNITVVIVNNKEYLIGECNGKAVNGTSCNSGTFTGREILCNHTISFPSNLSCEPHIANRIMCTGETTSQNCKGVFKGTFSDSVSSETVTIDQASSAVYNWSGAVTGFCSGTFQKQVAHNFTKASFNCSTSFNRHTLMCSNSELVETSTTSNNEVKHTSIHCKGELNVSSLICSSGEFKSKQCNGTKPVCKDVENCSGSCTERNCTNGGSPSGCNGEAGSVSACIGTMNNGVCSQAHKNLSIIQINSTHWVKGRCMKEIKNNECSGVFVGSAIVTCTGNPSSSQSDYDACKNDSSTSIGDCIGTTNGTGCYGLYSQKVKIGAENWVVSSENQTVHYNYKQISGYSVHRWENPGAEKSQLELSKRFFCNSSVIPGNLDSCNGSIYSWFDEQDDNGKPGMQRRRDIICSKGATFSYEHLGCVTGTHTHLLCVGRSNYTSIGNNITCLGNFSNTTCTGGGKDNDTCLYTGPQYLHQKNCTNNYFKDLVCYGDKRPENDPISFNHTGFSYNLDAAGRKVKIADFSIDKFTIDSAVADQISISKTVTGDIYLRSAKQNSSSLYEIDYPKDSHVVTFDEGLMSHVNFKDLALDKIKFRDFAVSDDCQLVKLTIKEMIINHTMFTSLSANQGVIQRLKVAKLDTQHDSQLNNFGYKQLSSNVAFGTIYVRNATVYLPYIPKSRIDTWVTDPTASHNYSVNVPNIGLGSSLMSFKVTFSKDGKRVILQFPNFALHDMDLDLLFIEDWALASNTLEKDQTIVASVLKDYKVDSRVIDYFKHHSS